MLHDEGDPGAAATGPGSAPGGGDDLAVIRDQTREILELLRALIQLLIPMEGGREGPSLEQLIAALMAQGKETLLTLQGLREDVNTLLGRASAEPAGPNGGHGPNGRAHA